MLDICAFFLYNYGKKDVGISLLDYINKLRVKKALHLIKQGQHSKREIAQMVGFATERTFYRVLKKHEEDAKEKHKEDNSNGKSDE